MLNPQCLLCLVWFLFVLSRRSNSSKPETLCANILETAFARGKDENNSVCSLIILQFFDLPDIFSCSPQSLGESSICYNDDQYVSWENTLKRKKLKLRLPLIVDNVKAYLMQAKWNGSQMFVTFMKLIFDGQKLSTTSETSKTTILHIKNSVQPRLSFVILRNDLFISFSVICLKFIFGFYFWLIKRWQQN